MAVDRDQLKRALDEELNSAAFNDYCPNGLQVEGSAVISRLVSGVTASQALIDRAVALEADAILVHHGYFWRGEDPRLVGMKGRRVSALIRANINLFAYHLPLDNHATLGNNAGLGRALNFASWKSLKENIISMSKLKLLKKNLVKLAMKVMSLMCLIKKLSPLACQKKLWKKLKRPLQKIWIA